MRNLGELLSTARRQVTTHQDKIAMGGFFAATGGPIAVGVFGGNTETAAVVTIGGVAISVAIEISHGIRERRLSFKR